jgi:orotidine-5'-phosphate decarboxylase
MIDKLSNVTFYKIGLELAYVGGLELAKELTKSGKKVFLDLKFHDISNTVARAVAQIADLGVTFLTIHAYPQTMIAAKSAIGDSSLKLLAVTVMTSYNDGDLREAGFESSVRDLVAKRSAQASDVGIHGLVLSAEEIPYIRSIVRPDMFFVTPGIRRIDDKLLDQKRVMTPAKAIQAGSNYLVVGRPITQAKDPCRPAQSFLDEI